jgi:hypothetical protein
MRGSLPDSWSWISNFHISCTRVRTKADWRPDGDIWICDSYIKETRVRTEYYIVRTIDRSFLYRNLERIWDWSSAEISVRMGCWDVQMDASWIETSRLSVRTDDAWSDWRPDGWNSGQMCVQTGWLDRPDGWQGTEIFDLSLSTKSSESALNSGIPVYSIYTHTSDFVQNEAKILTKVMLGNRRCKRLFLVWAD